MADLILQWIWSVQFWDIPSGKIIPRLIEFFSKPVPNWDDPEVPIGSWLEVPHVFWDRGFIPKQHGDVMNLMCKNAGQPKMVIDHLWPQVTLWVVEPNGLGLASCGMFEWGTNVIIESFWHPFSRGCFQEMILVLFVIWYDSTLQSLLGIAGISQPLRAYMGTGTP